MKAMLFALVMIGAVPAVALADQCTILQDQIDRTLGRRFDPAASTSRWLATQAGALHRDGKHAESVKMYEEAARAANITLEERK